MKQENDTNAKISNEENNSDVDSIEELAEPKFKYKRLLNDFTKIWTNDAVNCFVVHPKLLAIGTQWGKIYLMDHSGTIIQEKVINAHTVAVNQISIDEPGEYLGSCSNDGKILIYGLWSSEFNQVVSMDRPIRSIALEPEFSRSSAHQQFVTGDRVLVFHERTFFNRDKQAIIYAGKERDGFIHEISWKGPYIAFANDSGVRVYDRDYKTLITHVVREHDLSLRSELYPCHILWMDAMNFVIGWANTVTICDVKDTTGRSTFHSAESGGRFVEIRHSWDIGQRFICGLSCTHPNKFLVVLTVCKRATDEESSIAEKSKNAESGEVEVEGADAKQHVEKPEYPRVLLLEPLSFQLL